MLYLELRGVTKRYGSVTALDQCTFSVDAGKFFSLLGPSACGKTTVLRIVAGFEAPDDGEVMLDDVSITRIPPNRRDMAMVFQSYSLFPNMTARDNVEFGLRVRRRRASDRNARAMELLELVGLSAEKDDYPHQMSGGQQQRVALARALAVEPRVLLIDEPLSALDARVRLRLRDELREIQTRLGITVLYVTHDQEEALSISDRVAVMSSGRPEQIGSPAGIYAEPATRFVAEFLGTMNCLEGRVIDGQRGAVRCAGDELVVDAARGRSNGERVLVLVRPESIAVAVISDEHLPPRAIYGRVAAQAFLGPVTRLKAHTEKLGELSVDVPSASAGRFPVGTGLAVRLSTSKAGVLDLPGDRLLPDSVGR